jgi:membrane-bound hydrogenase subunit beta
MNILTPPQIIDELKAVAGAGFLASRITEWAEGVKGWKSRQIWVTITRETLRPAIRKIIDLHFPHVAVISFADTGAQVDLMYHLYIYWGVPREEILITLKVSLDKTDLKIPTITDLIPGALTSEREKQEMLGIEVVDIPDGRRLFLPDDFPQGVYPWRKDETGIPPDMVKNLWETGREGVETCVVPPAPPPPPNPVPPANPVNPV